MNRENEGYFLPSKRLEMFRCSHPGQEITSPKIVLCTVQNLSSITIDDRSHSVRSALLDGMIQCPGYGNVEPVVVFYDEGCGPWAVPPGTATTRIRNRRISRTYSTNTRVEQRIIFTSEKEKKEMKRMKQNAHGKQKPTRGKRLQDGA